MTLFDLYDPLYLYDRDFEKQMGSIDKLLGGDQSCTSDFLLTTKRPLQILCVKPLAARYIITLYKIL